MVEHLLGLRPSAQVTRRDLAASALPHFTGALYEYVRSQGTAERPAADDPTLADLVMAEFMAADIVVIGAPMYNFSVPTQLKAWIDRIVIPGQTFRFTEAGPIGLCRDKQIFIASARGSAYVGTPYETLVDHQEAYLRAIFSFIGLSEIHLIRAEGLQIPGADRQQALREAVHAARGIMTGLMLEPALPIASLAAASAPA